MRQISQLILIIWSASLLMTLSPFHEYDHKTNYIYSSICLVLVIIASFSIRKSVPNIGNSIYQIKMVRIMSCLLSLILISVSIMVSALLYKNGEGGLSTNRATFDENYSWYNYIFMLAVPSVILLALSKHSTMHEKRVGIIGWILCCLTLLFSGNRQFTFFSLVLVSVYFLSKSDAPRFLFRKMIFYAILVVGLLIMFSILRLDYLPDGQDNVVAKYMSTLTGARCIYDSLCNSYIETIFQLLYAYLGLNQAGLAYSVDFYYEQDGFPIISIIFPLLYRRLTSAGITPDISIYNIAYGDYIAVKSGIDFPNFFSTVFGGIGAEMGWHGIFIFFAAISILIYWLSKRLKRKDSSELELYVFLLMPTMLIVGVMQMPTSEPFFAMIVIQWFGLLILEKTVTKKSKNSVLYHSNMLTNIDIFRPVPK